MPDLSHNILPVFPKILPHSQCCLNTRLNAKKRDEHSCFYFIFNNFTDKNLKRRRLFLIIKRGTIFLPLLAKNYSFGCFGRKFGNLATLFETPT
jgi:hypothetical protein